MDMNISMRDKKLLLMFLGVGIFACGYFFGYRPQMEEAENIQASNVPLQERLNDLLELAENREFYLEETDSINETVDYSAVYGTIQKIVEGDPYKLIEKVAAVIARAILAEYSLVQAVEVTLHKPQAPIDGHFDDVLFVIRRERS